VKIHFQALSNKLDDKNEKLTYCIVDTVRWYVADVPTPASWFYCHFESPTGNGLTWQLAHIYDFSAVVTRSHGLHTHLPMLSPFIIS